MPNYLEYQKSISNEFKAYENRVRNLIDDANWGEEGRYKEIILINYLKRILPKSLSVGTGFVRNRDLISRQIDIIIYENCIPPLFSEGDFIITTPENVVGIIEVKSTITTGNLLDIIDKANGNGLIISGDRNISIFNGIFSYSINQRNDSFINALNRFDMKKLVEKKHWNEILPSRLSSCVNQISLGENTFIKLWPHKMNSDGSFYAEYSLYDLYDGLGISYFLSNLQEFILRRQLNNYTHPLEEHYQSIYYPISEGKEVYKMGSIQQNY